MRFPDSTESGNPFGVAMLHPNAKTQKVFFGNHSSTIQTPSVRNFDFERPVGNPFGVTILHPTAKTQKVFFRESLKYYQNTFHLQKVERTENGKVSLGCGTHSGGV